MRYCGFIAFVLIVPFSFANDYAESYQSIREKRSPGHDPWSLIPESLMRFSDHARDFTSKTLDNLMAEASRERPSIRRRIIPIESLFGRESARKETTELPVNKERPINKERETEDEDPEPSEVFVEEPHKTNDDPEDEVEMSPFNPFNIPFSFGFGLFTPWWKGPNICVERDEVDEPEKGNMTGFSINFEATQCIPTENTYSCTKRILNNGLRKSIIVKHQCCHGFIRRSDGRPGCREVKMDNVMKTLRSLAATRFADMIEAAGLLDKILAENFTIFAPLNDDLAEFDEVFEDNEILVSKPPSKGANDLAYFVGGHIMDGFINLHSMENDHLLQSLNGKTTIRVNKYRSTQNILTANCVPVNTQNNFATNGIVHLLSDVLPLPRKTVADVISGGPEFSIFSNLLSQSDMLEDLKDPEKSWTIFAPTDTAFKSMEKDMLQRLMSGEGCVDSILKHHLVKGTFCSSAVVHRALVENLLGKPLLMTADEAKKLRVNDVHMNASDILGVNGVVHVIDDIIIPQEAYSIVEHLRKGERTDLLDLIETANLMPTFESMKNVSFFIPSKDAMKNMAEEMLESFKENTEKLRETLLYHVAMPLTTFSSFRNTKEMATLAPGKSLRIQLQEMFPGFPTGAMVQCSPITSTDNAACGGVMHRVEKMMTPPQGNIMDVLKSMDGYNITKQLLELTDLQKKLEDESAGPYTLLAPTDEAFERFEKKSLDELFENKSRAEQVLRMHTLPETLCCSGVTNMFPFRHHYVRTLEGNLLSLHRSGRQDRVRFGPARAVRCDIPATNGLIHSVNRVILPSRRPTHSILDMDIFKFF